MSTALTEFITRFPLVSAPDTAPQAASFSSNIAGQTVCVETDYNPGGHYGSINHDRAAVVSLEAVPERALAGAADAGMEAAENAVRSAKAPDETDGGTGMAVKNNVQSAKAPDKAKGGSTGIVAVYDPAQYTLDIRSRGDSPAFIIFNDGEKAVSVQVSDERDQVSHMVPNHLSVPEGSIRRPGIYSFTGKQLTYADTPFITPVHDSNGEPSEGLIKLDTLIGQASKTYGLNATNLRVMLVVASDGMEKAVKWKEHGAGTTDNHRQQSTKIVKFSGIIEQALAGTVSGSENPAKSVLASALANGSHDNITVVTLPLKKGKGAPVAIMVADGFGRNGNRFAEAAVEGFVPAMSKLRAPLPDVEKYPLGTVRADAILELDRKLNPVGRALQDI